MAQEQPKIRAKQVAVNFTFPAHVEARSGNLATVQHNQETFVLSFYEAILPLLTRNDAAGFEAVTSVEARCVARVHVTPGAIKRLRDTLSENIVTYESVYGAIVASDQIQKETKGP